MSFFFFFLSFFIFFLSVSALFSLYSCSQFLYSSPSHLLYDDIHSSISRSLISANTNPPNFPGPLLLLSPTRLLLRSVKFFTFSFSRCHFLFFSVFFFLFLTFNFAFAFMAIFLILFLSLFLFALPYLSLCRQLFAFCKQRVFYARSRAEKQPVLIALATALIPKVGIHHCRQGNNEKCPINLICSYGFFHRNNNKMFAAFKSPMANGNIIACISA